MAAGSSCRPTQARAGSSWAWATWASVPDRDRSRQSGHRLRGRAGPRVGSQSRAWRVPYRGRWQDMAEGAVRERLDRHCAPGDGTGQPPHVVRRDVAVRAPTVGARVRRRGKRRLSLQGWRLDLGAPHAGPALGRDGQHRRRRGPDQSEPRLRAHRDQRGDVVGLEGPGRPLDQGVGFPRALRPAVLLLADARVTRRRSKAVLLLLPAAALGRRRQDNDADRPRRARGPSCAVDRPAEPRPHDPGERRRRVCHGERRQELAVPEQPPDRAVLHGSGRQQHALHAVRRPAGQQRVVRAVEQRGWWRRWGRRRGRGWGGGGGGGGGGGPGLNGAEWFTVTGGDGEYAVPAPSDSSILYVDSQNGNITRVDLKTGLTRSIRPYLSTVNEMKPANLKYRFNWTSPIAVSPRDANTA